MSRNTTYISAPFYKLSFGDVALQQQGACLPIQSYSTALCSDGNTFLFFTPFYYISSPWQLVAGFGRKERSKQMTAADREALQERGSFIYTVLWD
jgi:hypothetical protein